MAKFGDLINRKVPVLLVFFTSRSPTSQGVNSSLYEVAEALGNRAHIIKIDIEKNKELAETLDIKSVPSFVIYSNGQMVWRHAGAKEAQRLIELLEQFLIGD